MKKINFELALSIFTIVLLLSYVGAVIYTYRWYSQTCTVTESGLSSTSGIDGDLIINHQQTVYASVTNNRATTVMGNVTVNVNGTSTVNIYPRATVTIQPTDTWIMPNQTWTPTQTGDYTVEVVFEEDA